MCGQAPTTLRAASFAEILHDEPTQKARHTAVARSARPLGGHDPSQDRKGHALLALELEPAASPKRIFFCPHTGGSSRRHFRRGKHAAGQRQPNGDLSHGALAARNLPQCACPLAKLCGGTAEESQMSNIVRSFVDELLAGVARTSRYPARRNGVRALGLLWSDRNISATRQNTVRSRRQRAGR